MEMELKSSLHFGFNNMKTKKASSSLLMLVLNQTSTANSLKESSTQPDVAVAPADTDEEIAQEDT